MAATEERKTHASQRTSKRAKRSTSEATSETGARAAAPTDEPLNVTTFPELIRVQNASSNLVPSDRRYRIDRLSGSRRTNADTLSYTQTILAGAESLEIETTTRLQRALGDRRGQLYNPGMLVGRTLGLQNLFDNVPAACDAEEFGKWQGYHEAIEHFEVEGHWGSDYAGIGHQFVKLKVSTVGENEFKGSSHRVPETDA